MVRSRAFDVPELFGFLTGMRSMSACAALAWAAWLGAARGLAWAGRYRWQATALAAAEIVGDKLPGAPDRRVPASFLLRLLVGGAGAMALGGSPFRGVASAFAGTLLGRAARGATTRSEADWLRALIEDGAAIALASITVRRARRLDRRVVRIAQNPPRRARSGPHAVYRDH